MPSIRTVLRKTSLSNNKFPVYLRITYNRKSKFFKTIFDTTQNEWHDKSGRFTKNGTDYIQKNRILGKYEDKASKIIGDFIIEDKEFSLNEFERIFRVNSNPASQNVFNFWLEIIKEMISSDKIGNADVNTCTYNSLKSFNKDSLSLNFEDLNLTYLNKYEVFLRSKGGTAGGIGVKMRAIRAIFNRAIERKITKEDYYPFKVYKLSKFKSKKVKKALNPDEIQKIIDFDLIKYPHLKHTLSYFVFSFFTRGMNFADLMKLNWSNISNDKIYYTRQKTGVNFIIKILPRTQEILSFYKDYNTSTNYIFPIILKEGLTETQIHERKKKTLKAFNKELREIAKICNIQKPMTSYVARHSFANYLFQKGSGTEIIKESMGHKDANTTKAYLEELGCNVIDDACDVLLSF